MLTQHYTIYDMAWKPCQKHRPFWEVNVLSFSVVSTFKSVSTTHALVLGEWQVNRVEEKESSFTCESSGWGQRQLFVVETFEWAPYSTWNNDHPR